MDTEKSAKANLENGRTQRFLLGLVVTLACLFVALEHTIDPDDPLDDPDLLERLATDEELPPFMLPETQPMPVAQAEPKPDTRLVVVDNDEQPDPRQDEEALEEDLGTDLADVDGNELLDELAPPADTDDDVVSFRVVEDMPQFPGGPTELMRWLTRNLKYPQQAQQARLQGRVLAEFIVNTDGSVTDVRIAASLSPQCDGEVLRVLRMMPRWTAGVMDGRPCRTKVCIPVVFKL